MGPTVSSRKRTRIIGLGRVTIRGLPTAVRSVVVLVRAGQVQTIPPWAPGRAWPSKAATI